MRRKNYNKKQKKVNYLYQIYLQICQLKNDIFKLDIDKIEECLGVIEHNFLVIYNSKSNGDDEDGNNENMGS